MSAGRVRHAMLMCAGLGTRMRPFSDVVPKPLLPVMGVPCAQFALDGLAAAGVEQVVANIHHLPELARRGLEGMEAGGARLVVSDESRELLGSGGGLKQAESSLGSDAFFLVNGDVLSNVDLSALARAHARFRDQFGALITLTVFPQGPQGEAYREIIVDPRTGLISALGSKQVARPYFASVAVIETEALAALPPGVPSEMVPLILEPAVRAGRAGAFLADGIWHDMGNPALWMRAHADLIARAEIGALPSVWRRRIERASRRVASGAWISREVGRTPDVSGWAGPCYWAPLARGDRAPRELGPAGFVYGDCVSFSGAGARYAGAEATFG